MMLSINHVNHKTNSYLSWYRKDEHNSQIISITQKMGIYIMYQLFRSYMKSWNDTLNTAVLKTKTPFNLFTTFMPLPGILHF